jgi:hypothetical protein
MKTLKFNLGKIITTIVIILLVLIGSVGYMAWYNLYREVPTYYESAEEHFKYGSIGTENAAGVPYWIWLVLPRLFPDKLPGSGGYTSLGLTWEEGKETPVGISKKTIGFPRQGMTCAACHTATVRETAKDKPMIFPAGSASKFDFQAYLRFLFDCASDPRFTANYIFSELEYNHEFSWWKKLFYRYVIIPQTRKELLRQKDIFAWMDSRPDWGAGRMDAFNLVKFKVLDQPLDDTIGNSDIMPIWNQKQHQGFALQWDGLETSLTESNLIGAFRGGATRESLNVEGIKRVEDYIHELPPPQYPFTIAEQQVSDGEEIFDNNCASCHRLGEERTGHIIPIEEVGTDRHRLDMWTQAAADAYNDYGEGDDDEWDLENVRKPEAGYVAVSLEGLWLRAPYLHNGSVPTLTDLLEKPENRPTVFYRGYDVYDQENVGFVSNRPEAEKVGFRYDTSLPGNGNQGHLYGTDLTSQEKQALIEYLKTL